MHLINSKDDFLNSCELYTDEAKKRISQLSLYEALVSADEDYHYFMGELHKKIKKDYMKSSLYCSIQLFYYENNNPIRDEVDRINKMREEFYKAYAATEIVFKRGNNEQT